MAVYPAILPFRHFSIYVGNSSDYLLQYRYFLLAIKRVCMHCFGPLQCVTTGHVAVLSLSWALGSCGDNPGVIKELCFVSSNFRNYFTCSFALPTTTGVEHEPLFGARATWSQIHHRIRVRRRGTLAGHFRSGPLSITDFQS